MILEIQQNIIGNQKQNYSMCTMQYIEICTWNDLDLKK